MPSPSINRNQIKQRMKLLGHVSPQSHYTQSISIFLLIVPLISTFSFFPPRTPTSPDVGVTQRCLEVLPYPTSNINHQTYLTWYGKLGESLNGTTYEPGHVFSRHIAINYKCTDEQKSQNKTVFYDEPEFYKAFNQDNTQCTVSSTTAFNFMQNHVIASASNYIRGIDCKTGTVGLFNGYFVEYKRAIQNAKPTQAAYMASQKVTVHTFYPKHA